jgi:hypothetical protein
MSCGNGISPKIMRRWDYTRGTKKKRLFLHNQLREMFLYTTRNDSTAWGNRSPVQVKGSPEQVKVSPRQVKDQPKQVKVWPAQAKGQPEQVKDRH